MFKKLAIAATCSIYSTQAVLLDNRMQVGPQTQNPFVTSLAQTSSKSTTKGKSNHKANLKNKSKGPFTDALMAQTQANTQAQTQAQAQSQTKTQTQTQTQTKSQAQAQTQVNAQPTVQAQVTQTPVQAQPQKLVQAQTQSQSQTQNQAQAQTQAQAQSMTTIFEHDKQLPKKQDAWIQALPAVIHQQMPMDFLSARQKEDVEDAVLNARVNSKMRELSDHVTKSNETLRHLTSSERNEALAKAIEEGKAIQALRHKQDMQKGAIELGEAVAQALKETEAIANQKQEDKDKEAEEKIRMLQNQAEIDKATEKLAAMQKDVDSTFLEQISDLMKNTDEDKKPLKVIVVASKKKEDETEDDETEEEDPFKQDDALTVESPKKETTKVETPKKEESKEVTTQDVITKKPDTKPATSTELGENDPTFFLKPIFDEIDQDGNGKITFIEFSKFAPQPFSLEDIHAIKDNFADFDHDNKGYFTFMEMVDQYKTDMA